MPVCLILDFPGLRIEDRDVVADAINWPAEWAEGCYAHGAGTTNGDLRVVEIWETRDHWERFLVNRLHQGIADELGDRARPPTVTEIKFDRFDSAR